MTEGWLEGPLDFGSDESVPYMSSPGFTPIPSESLGQSNTFYDQSITEGWLEDPLDFRSDESVPHMLSPGFTPILSESLGQSNTFSDYPLDCSGLFEFEIHQKKINEATATPNVIPTTESEEVIKSEAI